MHRKPIQSDKITAETASDLIGIKVTENTTRNIWYGFNDRLLYAVYPNADKEPTSLSQFIDHLHKLSGSDISDAILEHVINTTEPGTPLSTCIDRYNHILSEEIDYCKTAVKQARMLKTRLHPNDDFTVKLGFHKTATSVCDIYKLTFNPQTRMLHWILIDKDQPILRKTWKQYHKQLNIEDNWERLKLTPQIYPFIRPNFHSFDAVALRNPSNLKEMELESFVERWYKYVIAVTDVTAKKPYVIKPCKPRRLPGNKDTKTFDFIDVEVSICLPSEKQKSYLEKHRSQIHADVMTHLEEDHVFKKKGIPVNNLEAYEAMLTETGLYLIRLRMKSNN